MIVEYNRMSWYIFCMWKCIQLMLLFVCLVKVMRGTLEPFDPSASYVHPSARPHPGKRSKLSIREASEFTLDDGTPESDEDEDGDEEEDEEEEDYEENSDSPIKIRRSSRAATMKNGSSKHHTLPFSPKKTRAMTAPDRSASTLR